MGEITAEPCLANIPFSSLTGARVAAELVGSHLEFQHEIPTLSLSLAMPGRVLDPESPNPRPLYSCHDFDRFHTSAVPAAISPNLWTPYTAMPRWLPQMNIAQICLLLELPWAQSPPAREYSFVVQMYVGIFHLLFSEICIQFCFRSFRSYRCVYKKRTKHNDF